jgi:iron(III) transport system substrate-binding protein
VPLKVSGWTAVGAVVAALMLIVEMPAASLGEDLVDLARKEGKVVWYTSVESSVAEIVAKAFQDKYRVKIDVVRTGSERVLTRFLQEEQSGVHSADVVHTSDAGDFVLLKQKGLLAKYRPQGVETFPAAFRPDRDEAYFPWRATLCVIMYNTRLVKPAEAPTGWMDLLDPKWKGKIVVGHPNYSGIVLNCVAALTKLFGWEYFQKLKENTIMIRQSANDPPAVVSAGERVIGGNGAEYTAYNLRARGNPIGIVYPKEGIPLVVSPSAIAKSAPHPNAAKLFTDFIFGKGVQQLLVTEGGLYVPYPGLTYPSDKPSLDKLKLLTSAPDELVKRNKEINDRFTSIFGV